MFEETRAAINAAERIMRNIMPDWDRSNIYDMAQTVIDDDTTEWDRNSILEAREFVAMYNEIESCLKKYVRDKMK